MESDKLTPTQRLMILYHKLSEERLAEIKKSYSDLDKALKDYKKKAQAK